MSAGSMMSMALTLAVVLGVMGIALRLLRKYTMGTSSSAGAVQMEVVQRLTIGQRQGLAVVRVGSRVLVVSMGDGGIRAIAELDPSDVHAFANGTARDGARDNATPAPVRDVLNLRALAAPFAKKQEEANADAAASSERVAYIAPLDDFKAVLNMAMSDRPHLQHSLQH